LREECRLRVFKNRVLRRMFGPKRGEIRGEWRRLQKEEFCDLHYSSNAFQMIKSRGMRWAGHVAHLGDRRGVQRVLVGNKGKR